MASSTTSRSFPRVAPPGANGATTAMDAIGDPANTARLDYIDWLHLLAVALLLPYHSARVFDVFDMFYVKNAGRSGALSAIIAFLDPWHMPFFFVLAGMSTCLTLRQRSGRQYLEERVRRLLVPLVFGILIIVPRRRTSHVSRTRAIPARTCSSTRRSFRSVRAT
jgi:uncharacterized membrane protein YcfT